MFKNINNGIQKINTSQIVEQTIIKEINQNRKHQQSKCQWDNF